MLIEAVERRFGSVDAVQADHALEFLRDNDGTYIAAETRTLTRVLGLKLAHTFKLPLLLRKSRNCTCNGRINVDAHKP